MGFTEEKSINHAKNHIYEKRRNSTKDPTIVNSEDRNEDVTDKKVLKAIKKEPPAPYCHYCNADPTDKRYYLINHICCDAEFTDKISLINHTKIFIRKYS